MSFQIINTFLKIKICFILKNNNFSDSDSDTHKDELLGVTAVIAEMISATENQASTDHEHPSKHCNNNLIKVL